MTKFNNQPPPTMAPQQNSNNQHKSTFAEKLTIGLEHAPPAFNLREQVIGAGGANLNYIRNETGAIASLRGRGSLFIHPQLGAESTEPLHLYIEHYRYEGLQAAKQLAKNLIETLQQELVHFQQLNQNTQNVSFPNGGTIIPQGQHVSQINVPPPMLAIPPPHIMQPNIMDLQGNQTAVMQSNFIQQNPPPLINAPPQPSQQTVIHQQIIPQTVPIQLQQGNMVLQQPVSQPPTIGNVNIPPPGIPMPIKSGQIVQFQQPPPPPATHHLNQPPPNVQIQHQQPSTATQIVLNPTQNYQYQYIQQPVQTGETQMQSNQVTIQHIYQPQQQIQGMVQSGPSQSQGIMDQFQHIRPQQFQAAPSQQYITVQGSAAYMVPPPTVIQQHSSLHHTQSQPMPGQITNSNIIMQRSHQLQQVQMQEQPTIAGQNIPPLSSMQHTQNIMQDQSNQVNGTDDCNISPSKEDVKSGSDSDENSRKTADEKSDNDGQVSDGNSDCTIQSSLLPGVVTIPPPPPQNQSQNTTIHPPPSQHLTSITLPAPQVQPPIMAVPPPISCVQHLVGNTLITTHPPAQTHTNQIYNQVPVSIQQIQRSGQQIHVSTSSGQHFLVNTAPQWQSVTPSRAQHHSMQQISSNGSIQNMQITHQQIPSSAHDYRAIPPPRTVAQHHTNQSPSMMTINPQVQVQFQPQMIQQFPSPHAIDQAQIISSQVTHPPPQLSVVPTQPPRFHLPPGAYQHQQNTIMTSFQHQMKHHPRFGNKRKLDDEDGGPVNYQPRMGMG